MSEKMHKVKPETYPSPSEEKSVKIYPTFTLDSDDLPALKDWKVGDKYMLVMEVEQMASRSGSEWQGDPNAEKDKVNATFKILNVGVKEEDFETEYARRRGKS